MLTDPLRVRQDSDDDYELYSSDTTEEGHADQDRRGSVPRARAAARHPRQPARLRPGRSSATSATARSSDQKLRSEDSVERATLDEREMQYLYKDGDSFHFMDTTLVRAAAHRRRGARRLGQLPDPGRAHQGGVLRQRAGRHRAAADRGSRRSRTPRPGIKGATASAQVKPATLETGLVVQVPPFVNTGDKVRVSTETGEYLSRA